MQKKPGKPRSVITNVLNLFTQEKAFCDNPIIGSRILNRLGLHVIRVLVSHAIIYLRQYCVLLVLWPNISREDRKSWFNNGYILKSNILTQQHFTQLREEFDHHHDSLRQSYQGDTCTASILLTEAIMAKNPGTQTLLENKTLICLLQFCSGFFLQPWFYFLSIQNGCRKKPSDTKNTEADPQKQIHSDAFHPTMKAWLFLHDVTPELGPFHYYAGSHKLSWRRLKWEYHRSVHFDQYIDGYSERGSLRVGESDRQKLQLAKPTVFEVPENTLVIANTFGFHHRGQSAENTVRDALWVSAWRAPFIPLPLPNITPLRHLFERRMSAFIEK